MAYLTGITTWANVLTDIRELICGRKNDDFGNSVPESERWRDPFSGLGSEGFGTRLTLAPPSSTSDRESLQEHRAGYWARVDDCAIFLNRTGSLLQHCRQTSIWTGWHSNFQDTLMVSIRVVTRNTISGNYSNAQIEWVAHSNAANGATAGVRSSKTAINLDADGNVTLNFTTGFTCTVRLTNPETGYLETNAVFVRNFKSEYRGGIDAWRNYIKNIGAVTTIVPPTGVDGTDWDYTGQKSCAQSHDNSGTTFAFPTFPNATGGRHLGVHLAHGLGIKTNAGLTGDRYEVSFNYCHSMFRILFNGLNINVGWGPPGVLSNGSFTYGVEAGRGVTHAFLGPFATTPLSTTEIQYFITVREDSLAITLYGDPSYQGRITSNMVARITGYDEEDSNKTWAIGVNNEGYASGSGTKDSYYRLGPHMVVEKAMVRGWMDGGRNWQTGDGRWDMMVNIHDISGYDSGAQGFITIASGGMSELAFISNDYTVAPIANTNTNPDLYRLLKEPGWRASSWTLSDGFRIEQNFSNYNSVGIERERGYIEDPSLILIPQGSYASGDELLDLTTNNRYKLFGRNSWSGWLSFTGPGYAQAMF